MILLEPRRTGWDLTWTMLRTPVRVHPLFWLMALLLSFHESIPFALVLITIGCLLLSVLVHEFGHAMCGRYYGDDANRVVVYWLGGLCIAGRELPGRWPRIFVSLWGPLAGIALGGAAIGALWASARGVVPPPNVYLAHALEALAWINLIWGAVNLVPVFPLDGGQILRELVAWKAPRRGDRLVFRVSLYVALVMAALGVALYVYEPSYGLLPAVFFLVLAYSSWHVRRQLAAYGSLGGDEEPRQPWEQDADWWKK